MEYLIHGPSTSVPIKFNESISQDNVQLTFCLFPRHNKKMAAEENEDKRKELKAEYEEKERNARK